MAKQTTITIETRSLLIVQTRPACRAWCPRCSAEADMIALPRADSLSGSDAAVLTSWLNSRDVHLSSGNEGVTLLCLPSLLARVGQPAIGDGFPSRRHDKERP